MLWLCGLFHGGGSGTCLANMLAQPWSLWLSRPREGRREAPMPLSLPLSLPLLLLLLLERPPPVAACAVSGWR